MWRPWPSSQRRSGAHARRASAWLGGRRPAVRLRGRPSLCLYFVWRQVGEVCARVSASAKKRLTRLVHTVLFIQHWCETPKRSHCMHTAWSPRDHVWVSALKKESGPGAPPPSPLPDSSMNESESKPPASGSRKPSASAGAQVQAYG